MAIPRFDPKFTVGALRKAAQTFHEAGKEYWDAAHKAGIDGAVIFLTMEDGSFMLFTRGEYRETLMKNICDVGAPTIQFGGAEP